MKKAPLRVLLTLLLCLTFGLAVAHADEGLKPGEVTGYGVPFKKGQVVSSTASHAASKVPTETEAYNAMVALKKDYPEGMRWTNDNYYGWNGGIFSGGYGCAGFAFLLSDAAFGDLPARQIDKVTIGMLHSGDILRVNNNTHSVIVLKNYGSYVEIAEGNYNSSIHWGRTMSADQVAASTYMMTRYPVGNFGDVYQIVFDANGGSSAPAALTKEKDVPLTLPTAVPLRPGYDFVGWATSATATTAKYKAGDLFTANANTTLYAVWKKATYPVIPAKSSQTYTVPSGSMKRGAYVEFVPPETGCYIFEAIDSDGKDSLINFYDEKGNLMGSNDDGGEGYRFKLGIELIKNQHYLIDCYYYNPNITASLDVSIKRLNTDITLTAKTTASGVVLNWNKLEDATGYYIYRKYPTDRYYQSYAYLKDADTYTDTSVIGGKVYDYCIRCDIPQIPDLGCTSNVVTVRFLAKPAAPKLSNLNSGVKVTWEKIDGANGYYVQRKTGTSGTWKTTKTIDDPDKLSYINTTVKDSNGSNFYYRVKAFYKDSTGTVVSPAGTSKYIRRLTGVTPTVTNTGVNKLKIAWAPLNSKATGYQIEFAANDSFTNATRKTFSDNTKAYTVQTNTMFAKGKTVYVRTRCYYKTSSGVYYYGPWTKTSIKTTK